MCIQNCSFLTFHGHKKFCYRINKPNIYNNIIGSISMDLLNYLPFVPKYLTCLCSLVFHMPAWLHLYIPIHIFCVLHLHALDYFMPDKMFRGSLLYLALIFLPDYLTFNSTQNPKTNSCFKSYIPKSYLIGLPCCCIHRDNNLRAN